MATEGAKHTHIRFRLQVDMQCRCMGCIDKIDKAMAAIRTFTGVETSVGDVGTGVVAVAGKVDPAELCQWLKRKTRKDVKIVRPRRPSDNRNKQNDDTNTLHETETRKGGIGINRFETGEKENKMKLYMSKHLT
ncbi:heavy metal-associated isoprenylated plant protein 9-like isoform X4 [Triticum dicoccoides]|uniref:heavy metal-associated isoprenylated plant protein 9-like isoform X4 n=1 Tax=Triticum dicoccoides TaxID=85692 RepID=UPI0018916A92|nr:heavy metal-associated isoprenylated plant protein 9-like isoform X4 [Triticum dicoccoides]